MTYVSQNKIFYRVTYLEMNKPPLFNWPTPINKKISLLSIMLEHVNNLISMESRNL